MSPSWIDKGVISKNLQTEANSIAARLGHRLTSWLPDPAKVGRFMARCITCNDAVTVAARRFGVAPTAGAAVELWCKPRPVK